MVEPLANQSVCLCDEGWHGIACDFCDTKSPRCGARQYCHPLDLGATVEPGVTASSGKCECEKGYRLDSSEANCVPHCEVPCMNGDCVAPNECRCALGWLGRGCNYCKPQASPCSENARCLRSTDPVDDTDDALAIADRNSCVCNDGYGGDGVACEPVCPEGCVFGTCVRPGECRCDPQWENFQFQNCTECTEVYEDVDDSVCLVKAVQPEELVQAEILAAFPKCKDCTCRLVTCPNTIATPCITLRCLLSEPPESLAIPNAFEELVRLRLMRECMPNGTWTLPPAPVLPCVRGSQCQGFRRNASAIVSSTPATCVCKPGYEVDSRIEVGDSDCLGGHCCKPVCEPPCKNGGSCIAPNTCACSPGWGGPSCKECPEDRACSAHALCFKVANESTFHELIGAAMFPERLLQASWVHKPKSIAQAQYGCFCPGNFTGDGMRCDPICEQGCIGGTCVSPNVCECDRSKFHSDLAAWQGDDCSICVEGAHGCGANETCYGIFEKSGEATLARAECYCDSGFYKDGDVCKPVCTADCVHGECTAPDTCTCEESETLSGPAWTGPLCTDCVQGAHDCHENAKCSDLSGRLHCECLPGWIGDGWQCEPVCSAVDCGEHGRCVAPETCGCDLGWTGANCTEDCLCNFHSTCTMGVGLCDACQNYTAGPMCAECAPGAWGVSHETCQPCPCNQHGTCDKIDGTCHCDAFTTGDNCEKCGPQLYGDPTAGGKCVAGCNSLANRVLMTTDEGYFGSGEQRYCQSSREGPGRYCHRIQHACSFLITPAREVGRQRVTTIVFDEFATECAWDIVRVYEGPSFSSPLLGVFSGIELPPVIRTRSPEILVHMYSDFNWALEGFEAHFYVEDCVHNCSGHGHCDTASAKCICASGWTGDGCERPTCPSSCGEGAGRGSCNQAAHRCFCSAAWTGADCGTRVHRGAFTTMPAEMVGPRNQHSMVYRAGADEVWVYGGFDQYDETWDRFRADLEVYSFDSQSWARVREPLEAPIPRAGHTAVVHADKMLVFGGRVSSPSPSPSPGGNSSLSKWISPHSGVATNEFWSFDFTDRVWTPLAVTGTTGVTAQAVYGHTATIAGDAMHILGGLGRRGELVWQHLRYDLRRREWQHGSTAGSFPGGLFGHSAVYAPQTDSIYVYGGRGRKSMQDGYIQKTRRFFSYQRFATRDTLWVYSTKDAMWRSNELGPGNNLGAARFLHASAMLDKYMIIYGGSPFQHDGDHRCYDAHMLVYDVECKRWLPQAHPLVTRLTRTAPAGSVGAAMAIRSSVDASIVPSSLLISGGFRGRSLGGLSIALSTAVSCDKIVDEHDCVAESACVLCTTGCAERTSSAGLRCRDAANVTNATTLAINMTLWEEGLGIHLDSCVADKSPNCTTLKTCSACASVEHDPGGPACAWVFKSIGPGRHVHGSCEFYDPRSKSSVGGVNGSTVVVNASYCDPCGLQPSCTACNNAKDLSKPMEPVPDEAAVEAFSDLLCRWYPQHNGFRYSFCYSPSVSAVTAVDQTSKGDCKKLCQDYKSCESCGGAPGCTWCQGEQQCIPLEMFAYQAAEGQCTQISPPEGNAACPTRCESLTSCSACFKAAQCGWCMSETGDGHCVVGDHSGASDPDSSCYATPQTFSDQRGQAATATTLPLLSPSTSLSLGGAEWRFHSCPNEDECTDASTHKCSPHANCTDVIQELFAGDPPSYTCDCRAGYAGNGEECDPVCDTFGCDPSGGACVSPDVCNCTESRFGRNCSLDCDEHCNGHSKCARLDIEPWVKCESCLHNTRGDRCQFCNDGFLGDATGALLLGAPFTPSTACATCSTWCNRNSNECVSSNTGGIECLNCQNHSTGRLCDECLAGFFASKKDGVVTCKPCECNGHGSLCDPVTGSDCKCDAHIHSNPSESAGKRQCSFCIFPGYIAPGGVNAELSEHDRCLRVTPMTGASRSVCLGGCAFDGDNETVVSEEYYVDLALERIAARPAVDTLLQINVSSGVLWAAVYNGAAPKITTDPREWSCAEASACAIFECSTSGCTGPHQRFSASVGVREPRLGQIPLRCDVFDAFGGLHVTFASTLEATRFKYHMWPNESATFRDECARCVEQPPNAGFLQPFLQPCVDPCVAGMFRDPAKPFLCTPCRCNGHGDTCSSTTGGSCGLRSEGCNHTSGENCKCAHGTVTDASKCRFKSRCTDDADCSECQCNTCDAMFKFDTPEADFPIDGKQCYQQSKVRRVVEREIRTGEFHHYYTDARSLRFTNVDVRLVVEVFEGQVHASVSRSDDFTLDVASAVHKYPAAIDVLAVARNIDYVSALLYPSSSDKGKSYITVEAVEDSKYSLYFDQNILQINLFVFFSVFFSCFFLFFSLLAGISEVKLILARRQRSREADIALRQLRDRPVARVALKLRERKGGEHGGPATAQLEAGPTAAAGAAARLDQRVVQSKPRDDRTVLNSVYHQINPETLRSDPADGYLAVTGYSDNTSADAELDADGYLTVNPGGSDIDEIDFDAILAEPEYRGAVVTPGPTLPQTTPETPAAALETPPCGSVQSSGVVEHAAGSARYEPIASQSTRAASTVSVHTMVVEMPFGSGLSFGSTLAVGKPRKTKLRRRSRSQPQIAVTSL